VNLRSLQIGSNQLTGTIPAELGRLTKLTTLFLDSNQLTGYTTGILPKLTNVRWFRLDDNLFDQSTVDAIIDDIYQNRGGFPSLGIKRILDIGGTNAAPGSTACSQIATLRKRSEWTINCNGC
jgi:hypothetical protein